MNASAPGDVRAPPGFSTRMYNDRMKATRRGLRVAMILLCAWTARAWADSIEERIAPCLACHGEKGQSTNPEIPSLGAQTAPYVLIQLFLFREKLRRLDIMNDAVKGFTDDDLRTFADTISKLPPPRPTAKARPIRRAWRVGKPWFANIAATSATTPISLAAMPSLGSPVSARIFSSRPCASTKPTYVLDTTRRWATFCSLFPTRISSISPILPLNSLRGWIYGAATSACCPCRLGIKS